MASANGDQDHQLQSFAEKLLAVGKPCFNVFEERRLAGVPPPEMGSASDTLAIPSNFEDLSTINLIREDGSSAAWLVEHIRRAEDVVMARVPASAGDSAASCIFPRVVQNSWPKTEFKPVHKSEASCLRITDVRGKGKGCVVARAVPRGELVGREYALLLMPRTFAAPQETATALAKKMLPKQRAAFYALYNCKSAEPDDALGIVRTNSFLVPGVPGHNALYLGVFETFARINHRCGGFPLFCDTIVIMN